MTDDRLETPDNKEDNLLAGAKGGAIAFALKVASTALAFINQIILARILGAGGIGEVLLAISVMKVASQIAKFGMEETMMRFVPIYKDQKNNALLKGAIFFAIKFCLVLSALFMLLIFLLSKFIATDIFHSPMLLKLLPVIALAVPAGVLRDVIAGIVKGYKDTYRALLPENLISPFIRIVIFLLLTLIGVSPLYAVIAFVSGEILAVVLSIKFLLQKLVSVRSEKAQCERKRILEVAYTVIFTSVSLFLYTQADIWILGIFTTTTTVGIYGVAAKLVLLVYFPMYAFSSIIPPLMSSLYAAGDYEELENITRKSSRWILSMAMPIILVLILEGRLILRYIYGLEFEAGYIALVILTSIHLINTAAGLVGFFLQMTGQHKIYMKINVFFGILNVILNIILVPRYGMVGAAAATAFCISMLVITSTFTIHKKFSIITLAKGLKFDIGFITGVLCIYLFLNYAGIESGYHVLLVLSLAIYLWKSIVNHDIPWRMLVDKYK